MAFTPEEAERQIALLRKVRTKDHETLIQRSIGQRIIDAKVPVNRFANVDVITDRTHLFATREKMGAMAIRRLWAGNASIGGSCELIEDILAFTTRYPDSDVLAMGRLDWHVGGGYRQDFFSVGIQQVEPDGVPGELYPLDGIKIADLEVLAGMVIELERLRNSGELSCLSAECLINAEIPVAGHVPLP